MKNLLFGILSTLFVLGITNNVLDAQPSIQKQYEEFYEKSNTWEDFKVIKLHRLDDFWKLVSDTLQNKRNEILTAKTEITDLNTQLTEVKLKLTETETSLVSSEELNESIAFLGIQFAKSTYNIIVWLIILALCAGVGTLYFMFKRSNTITRQTRREFQELELENQKLREKARETQIKLKRELQTALNRLSEQRV